MRTCFNPAEHRLASGEGERLPLCTVPGCGFLLTDASVGNCQVTNLIGRNGLVDSYVAISAGSSSGGQAQLFMKVFRKCVSGSFLRLESLLSLRHPNIQPLVRTGGIPQESALYALSLCAEHGSLAKYVHAGSHVPLPTLLNVIMQIAQGLQYAHERNVVHGHIKPENCLLLSPEVVQIADFQQSILTRETAPSSSIYTAPEQREGKLLPASDQYALALRTCRVLLGEPVLRGTEARDISSSVGNIISALPMSLQQTLRRALSQHPAERFPSVQVFTEALRHKLNVCQFRPSIRSLSTSGSPVPLSSFPRETNTSDLPRSSPSSPLAGSQEGPPGRTEDRSSPPPFSIVGSLGRLPGHTDQVTIVRWSADGTRLASAGPDQTVRLWYIRNTIGTPQATLEGHEGKITALCWSPDGQLLATATNTASIRLWQIPTSTSSSAQVSASWWGHDGEVTSLCWSPDGSRLVSSGKDQTVRVWDPRGKNLGSWRAHGRSGVTALAWNPDGQVIASGGGDRFVSLWEASTGRQLFSCAGHRDEIRRLCWSPDGRWLVSTAGKKDVQVRLWNRQSGQGFAILEGHSREIADIFWPSNATWFGTVARDRTLRCWNGSSNAYHPGAPLGTPTSLEEEPLVADYAPASNLIALGTVNMLVLILQIQA